LSREARHRKSALKALALLEAEVMPQAARANEPACAYRGKFLVLFEGPVSGNEHEAEILPSRPLFDTVEGKGERLRCATVTVCSDSEW
jgi:hypothetical protein